MISQSTNRDMQRVTFIESLHNSLKRQAAKAIIDQQNFVVIAGSYIRDGLEEPECVELLMIDGVPREAAEGYVAMAMEKEEGSGNDLPEYSFQFEDHHGKIWSSYDIDRTIKAANDNEAWETAESMIGFDPDMDGERVVSVTRIS